ncbi:MAG: hypothetical protein MSS47_02080, partial [Bacteroidales bacterium]|nr:hypothetical protein [Bacteroidales bacterium]
MFLWFYPPSAKTETKDTYKIPWWLYVNRGHFYFGQRGHPDFGFGGQINLGPRGHPRLGFPPLPPFCFIPQNYRFFVQPENLNNSCSLDFSSDFTKESLCEHPLTLFQKACPFSDTLFETVSLLGVLPPYAVALLSPIGWVCVVKYRPPFGVVVIDDFEFIENHLPG